MGLARLVINCKRCYEIHADKAEYVPGAKEEKVYKARNEALKALENADIDPGVANMLARKCVDCDFQSPQMSKYILKKNL